MDTARYCFYCDFFHPDWTIDQSMIKESDWARGDLDGECHYDPPKAPPPITRENGDEFQPYGKFPLVCVEDWCGKFQARQTSDATPASH